MKVCIITEGTAKTGYGHLSRCLAIYQGFEEKGILPNFIANCDVSGNQVLEDIQIENFDWIDDSERLLKMIHGSDITIIDSYLATLSLYEKISAGTKKCVYLDDTQRMEYPPGVIINGAVGAEDLLYKTTTGHELLLGLEYAPLRKAFWGHNVLPRPNSETDVLITIGAQDYDEISIKVLDLFLKSFPKYSYHVVLGYHDFGEKLAPYQKNKSVTFYYSLNAEGMRDLMLTCLVAVSAAGQASYELARVGIGMILIQVADNQRFNMRGWGELGYIDSFIEVSNLSKLKAAFSRKVNEKKSFPRINGDGVRNIVRTVLG